MNGFIEERVTPPTIYNQRLDGWHNDPSIMHDLLSKDFHVANKSFTASLDHANDIPDPTTKARYPCKWPGCGSSFGRPADRDRHVRTKHGNARTYYCRESGCKKGVGYGKPYSRIDKLQEHMRKKHPAVAFRGTM
jgi:hypothetical protein